MEIVEAEPAVSNNFVCCQRPDTTGVADPTARAKGKARKPDPLFNDKVSVNENGAISRGACQYWAGDGPGGIPGLDVSYCRCPSCKGTWWVDLHAIYKIREAARRKREADLLVED